MSSLLVKQPDPSSTGQVHSINSENSDPQLCGFQNL